jgi:hypothetical protein
MLTGERFALASALGFPETRWNISNKIARSGLTAVFFIQCLSAIGCTNLWLEESYSLNAGQLLDGHDATRWSKA